MCAIITPVQYVSVVTIILWLVSCVLNNNIGIDMYQNIIATINSNYLIAVYMPNSGYFTFSEALFHYNVVL